VNIINKKCREADLLAARFYKLAEGDRSRAARDWLNKVKEAADLIKLYRSDALKCRKKSTSNIAYLSNTQKNVENVERNVEAGTVGIVD
tara:strand:+ start:1369 stop:1635 length:267 start_codon:yes stop_codon:yes gene_type:complete